MQTKYIVFVLGGPGAGKGTLIQAISNLYSDQIAAMSAGDLLRQKVLSL